MKCALNNIILRCYCCLLFSAVAVESNAQTPLFKTLEVTSKLSGIKVLLTRQDASGYLWLGTNNGILKFDGLEYKTVPFPDSLKNIHTSALLIHENELIVGLENGSLIQVNTKTLFPTSIKNISNAAITSLIQYENNIWAGTEGQGLVRIREDGLQVYTTQDGLADNYIHSLEIVSEKLAVGTDLGLSLVDISSSQIICKNFDTSSGLCDNLILALKTISENEILMGMQNGTLCNLNVITGQLSNFPNFNALSLSPVLRVLQIEEEILVITERDGAFILNRKAENNVQQFLLQPENDVVKIPVDCLVDQEGNLLVSFGENELTIADFRIQFIRDHDGETFSDAQCLISDKQGNLWFANNEGIFKHPGEFSNDQLIEKFYSSPKKLSKIITLCQANDDQIWFGTFGSGLGCINTKTKKVKLYTEKDGLINNNVLSITIQDSTLWMATLGGACSMRMINNVPFFESYDSKSKLGSNFIYTVYADKKGNVWFGTDGNGLVKFHNYNFTSIIKSFEKAGKSIVSITEDEHGNLWFTSTDSGLQWTNGRELHSITINTDRDKVDVYAIHNDPQGNIIALTSLGIAVVNHHSEKTNFIRPGFEIKVNYLNVIAEDINGTMWLGTEEALIRYRDINNNKKIRPRPYLETVDVMLQAVDTSQHIFEYNQNHFTFKLASIWLQDPDAVVFQYKLQGYDVGWVTTRDHAAIFSKLAPGKYTFLVKCSANNDWSDSPIQSYSFTILRPYWQETWFYIAFVIGIILLIWLILKLRLNGIRKKELLAREKVQSQFDTLRNQVNPHFLFNSFNTLISIISYNQDAAIGYVEKLSDYFRIVLEQREKDVITIKEELELVNSYLFLQKQRFADNLQIEIRVTELVMKSLIPPLTLQLLVENAIKHNVISKSRPLSILIQGDENGIMVSNNIQKKITQEASTGIGLENIKHRYKILFDREIEILADDAKFVVVLPLIREQLKHF